MLFLVSTPIGNCGDISERARRVLQEADCVACEDTRTSRQLFVLLGIKARELVPYHEHNADKMRPQLLKKLSAGMAVALVSDAGTPLISDPGYKLARDCRAAGIPVTAVPGANAVLPALQLSGFPTNAFYFAGFLPPKGGPRRQALAALRGIGAPLIVFEAPHRLVKTLADAAAVLGDRPAAVVREITKKFEEARQDSLAALLAKCQAEGPPKGEIVLVIGGAEEKAATPALARERVRAELRRVSPKEAVAQVALETGLPKKEVYRIMLEERDGKK